MATLNFAGTDKKTFTPVSTALSNLRNAQAGTIIVLIHKTVTGSTDFCGLVNSGASAFYHSLLQGSGPALADDDGLTMVQPSSTITDDTTNWYWYAVDWSATLGTTENFHWRNHTSGGSWTHATSAGNNGSTAATPGTSGHFRIGSLGDFATGSKDTAVVAVWAGTRFSNSDYATWTKTSDLYGHALGPPSLLVECNASTLVDLIGGSTYSSANSSGTALTGGDPPSWTFDGLGASSAISGLWIPTPREGRPVSGPRPRFEPVYQIAEAGVTDHPVTSTVSGGGNAVSTVTSNRNVTSSTSGGGKSTATQSKGASVTSSTSGGGGSTATQKKGAFTTSTTSSGGSSTSSQRKGAFTLSADSGGGTSSSTDIKGARITSGASGGGSSTSTVTTGRNVTSSTSGGGNSTSTTIRPAVGVALGVNLIRTRSRTALLIARERQRRPFFRRRPFVAPVSHFVTSVVTGGGNSTSQSTTNRNVTSSTSGGGNSSSSTARLGVGVAFGVRVIRSQSRAERVLILSARRYQPVITQGALVSTTTPPTTTAPRRLLMGVGR